jgi:hypothetical protein
MLRRICEKSIEEKYRKDNIGPNERLDHGRGALDDSNPFSEKIQKYI